jgi:hypothetical protein
VGVDLAAENIQGDGMHDKLVQLLVRNEMTDHEELATKVERLFADEGYVTPDNAKKVQAMVNQMAQLAQDAFQMPTMVNVALDKQQQTMQKLMTGPEWYARFKKELDSLYDNFDSNPLDTVGKAVALAARRAAGIDETSNGGNQG